MEVIVFIILQILGIIIHKIFLLVRDIPQFPTREILFQVSVWFQDANYAYVTRQGILMKIRACEHLQKFCEHEQASAHLIFVSNSSKG